MAPVPSFLPGQTVGASDLAALARAAESAHLGRAGFLAADNGSEVVLRNPRRGGVVTSATSRAPVRALFRLRMRRVKLDGTAEGRDVFVRVVECWVGSAETAGAGVRVNGERTTANVMPGALYAAPGWHQLHVFSDTDPVFSDGRAPAYAWYVQFEQPGANPEWPTSLNARDDEHPAWSIVEMSAQPVFHEIPSVEPHDASAADACDTMHPVLVGYLTDVDGLVQCHLGGIEETIRTGDAVTGGDYRSVDRLQNGVDSLYGFTDPRTVSAAEVAANADDYEIVLRGPVPGGAGYQICYCNLNAIKHWVDDREYERYDDIAGLSDAIADTNARSALPCPLRGFDMCVWDPCSQTWVSLFDHAGALVSALAENMPAKYWPRGGAAAECYGSAIGDSAGAKVVDLDARTLTGGNWSCDASFAAEEVRADSIVASTSIFADELLCSSASVTGTLRVNGSANLNSASATAVTVMAGGTLYVGGTHFAPVQVIDGDGNPVTVLAQVSDLTQ
ncbi:MAG: hypothetical protein IJ678_00115 [Kiritimatiellae bacterium]|nr:hypothetical protein [Kiritimatiellia bacterium]MBR1835972.1 hypothetical protein [Kiritimatiellia bacterium]